MPSDSLERLRELTNDLAHELDGSVGHILDMLKLVLTYVNSQVMILDTDNNIIYTNPKCDEYNKRVYGKSLRCGHKWYEEMGIGEPEEYPSKTALQKRRVVKTKFISPVTGVTMTVVSIPLINNGESGTICIYNEE